MARYKINVDSGKVKDLYSFGTWWSGTLAEKHETWSTGKSCYDTIEYPEARPEEEKQKIEQEIQTAS